MRIKKCELMASCHGELEGEVTFVTNSAFEFDMLQIHTNCNYKVLAPSPISRTISVEAVNIAKPSTSNMKVIFNPPATILYVGDKKYVSKVHDEEFDEEKGLLMCLAKANGITHLELKQMIKNAKRPEKKEKKTKK